MGFSDTSLIWRSAMTCQVLGFVFMLACICSDYMNAAEIIPNMFKHLGFWDICDDTMTFACQDLVSYVNLVNDDPDWVYGSRALVTIGIIVQILTIFLTVYMAYTSSSSHFPGLISAIGCGLSIIFSLIGGIIFVVRGNDLLEEQLEMDADPSWSFIMFLISESLVIIAIGLHAMEACRTD